MSLQIEYKHVGELDPYKNNSRTHSDDQIGQLMDSIVKFGFTNPILVDEEGQIIAGHGRFIAALGLDIDEVPTITLTGLSEAEKAAYVIADNKLALNAGWDYDLLTSEIEFLKDEGFDLDLLGFSEKELVDILGDSNPAIIDDFKEVDEAAMAHECPKCGFEFN
jgi:ParB-like chromosome segregation protein Spo0J